MPETTAVKPSAKKPSVSQFEPTLSGAPVPQPQPTDVTELIRARAYQLYELRGRKEGHAEEDWLQAEIDFLSSRSSKAAA